MLEIGSWPQNITKGCNSSSHDAILQNYTFMCSVFLVLVCSELFEKHRCRQVTTTLHFQTQPHTEIYAFWSHHTFLLHEEEHVMSPKSMCIGGYSKTKLKCITKIVQSSGPFCCQVVCKNEIFLLEKQFSGKFSLQTKSSKSKAQECNCPGQAACPKFVTFSKQLPSVN